MNAGSALWSMATQILAYSVILTWIYVGTGGSVLMTGLFHALANGLVPLTNGLDPDVVWDIRGVVFPIIAILIVVLGGFSPAWYVDAGTGSAARDAPGLRPRRIGSRSSLPCSSRRRGSAVHVDLAVRHAGGLRARIRTWYGGAGNRSRSIATRNESPTDGL